MKIKKRDLIFALMTVLIFTLLVDKYYLQGALRSEAGAAIDYMSEEVDNRFGGCDDNEVRVDVSGGYLCRTANVEPSPWLEIYDTYPKSIDGKEAIFGFLSEGSIKDADLILQDIYPVPRFEPVELGSPLTWEENPYDERYWRFLFYSLRPTRHLLYAGMETGEDKYNDKLIEVMESFVDTGIDKKWPWDDYHGTAFRTMVLINTWWKLREQNALPVETSTKMLQALEEHGTWLMDEEHFEGEHNHGITQASALFLLSITFPDLPDADQWNRVSRQRLDSLLTLLVDNDGVQVENSPYYHFYSLEKFWEIYDYSQRYDIPLSETYHSKIAAMTRYATYILHPDLSVPMLGASLEKQLNYSSGYKSIASIDPHFEYVITKGESGQQPPETNARFPVAGQTILRSGWGEGEDFANQTQIVFDIGTYRTPHSDLDALNFVLYSNGADLIVDPGLYTYEENEFRHYFNGTAAHNTVVVDGKHQRPGRPEAGKFVEGEGYVYQLASHNLYPGVTHDRGLALLGHDLVLVVDHLVSEHEHDYDQMFHLAPGASVDVDGLTVAAQLEKDDQRVTIHQLIDPGLELSMVEGQESPPAGLCSFTYENAVPCTQLSYKQHASVGTFITLIEIGEPDQELTAEVSDDLTTVTVHSTEGDYTVQLDWPDETTPERRDNTVQVRDQYDMTLTRQNGRWTLLPVTPTPSGAPVDTTERYNVVTQGGKLAITGVGTDLTRFDATINNLQTYPSIGATAYTDIPSNPKDTENFRIYEQEDYLPIFGYHYVILDSEKRRSSYDVQLGDFVHEIEFATNVMGCQWYTLGDILENYVLQEKKIPRRACVMTFDDGHRNNFENVLPVLQDFGAVATFYILPGRIGQTDRYMTWDQVDELYRYGNEIGSHSVSSGGLIDAGWDHDELVYQIEQSKQLLENSGYDVKTFAYPLGQYTDEIIDIVQQSGYIGGRSSEKDHSWLDRRAQTISASGEHRWTMSYARVDIRSLEEIGQDLAYTTWWQFEEGYAVKQDDNNNLTALSSDKPTDTSYAVLALEDAGDAATNKFAVAYDGTYTFEIYAVTGEDDEGDFSRLNNINVYVDDQPQPKSQAAEPNCRTLSWKRYCSFLVEDIQLTEGTHTITIEAANDGDVLVDKFRLYREFAPQQSYDVKIVEYETTETLQSPDPLEMEIHTDRFEVAAAGMQVPDIPRFVIWLGVIGGLVLLYEGIKKVTA